ncbi:uncharacterized protein Dana_GF11801 [Drosophila ananassae]|uniref:BRCT domain-containing protein n=1 Tax=Drosophila ananassae TaxID=7217 RepID=B3MG38_DROAN|nr:microcephalin [Drosophila ananassae]EDV36733.2 uncharacterized protein Dana_GF11801 [Drosophila ananassae]
MDKFLQRNPTWKTKTYEAAVATAAKKKPLVGPVSRSQASPARRPLQEQADSNFLPHQLPPKSLSQGTADNLLSKERQKLQQPPEENRTIQLAVSKAIEQHRSESKATEQESKQPEPPASLSTPTRKDRHWARLQEDLNSPNAALRIRAIRALKSPTKSVYDNFDVSHTEQCIITEEERNPKEPPTLTELLKDVIVYVEVRTGQDNRSEGVKTIIGKMGAQINDRLTRNTTHVVFKDGLLSTYKKASEWNIPVVSILWIEACKVQRKLCDPVKFPISNIHMYEYPELFGKIPRVRCMQPDSELSKRPRKQKGTPTSSKDNEPGSANAKPKDLPSTPTSTPTNDISRFFRALTKAKHKVDATESPATNLLNRISSGCYTPLPAAGTTPRNSKGINGSGDAAMGEQIEAQKKLSFVQTPGEKPASRPRRSTVEPPKSTPPVRTNRRRSCAAEISSHEPRMTRRRSSLHINSSTASSETPAPQIEPRMTRRRSSLHLAGKLPEEPAPQQTIETISEELASEEQGRNSIVMEKIQITNKTDYLEQSLDISVVQSGATHKVDRRGTLYTLEWMDITGPRRLTVATSSSELNDVPEGRPSLSTVTTQTSNFLGDTPVTPLFSSTRLPNTKSTGNRRRTIFNMDMDVINESIERINSSHRLSLAMANEAELGECYPRERAVAPSQPQPEESTPKEPKRRRLFNPNDEVVVTPQLSSRKSRLSITGSTGSAQKRRRSLATAPNTCSNVNVAASTDKETSNEEKKTTGESTNESTAENFVDPETAMDANATTTIAEDGSVKQKAKRSRVRHLVHTNMHHEQIQVIYKALRKLRGMRLDPTVTQRTTHLVSLEPRRTLNLLRGLMRGVWIVNYQWVLASMRAGKWVNEEPYELTRFSRAIEICRTERQAFGVHYQCELFRFMEPFYVSSLCQPIQFNNMKELLLLGGAKLTENRFKAKYIIGDKRRAEDERIYLSPYWVLDSITNMQIQRFGKYLMKSAIITPAGIRYEDPKPELLFSQPRRYHDFVDPPLVMDK